MNSIINYGGVPVPYAVLWSDEEAAGMHVAKCAHARAYACCQVKSERGSGKPRFGTPHMDRQREVIVNDWCDLCARPLKGRTKVSLSHAGHRMSGTGLYVMQVEPMVHKDCAVTCLQQCPSLKRDIAAGTLFVRQVLKHRTLLAMLSPDAVMEFTQTAHIGTVVGHAKVELLHWKDRNLEWLMTT